jgi:hypothetical protein
MDLSRALALAGVQLNESSRKLCVPEQPNLRVLSQGKDPLTHMKPHAPAKVPGDSNLHPAGTGKKQTVREEAAAIADEITAKVQALGKQVVEGQEQFIDYRYDALKRILAMVSKYVD